MDVELIDIFNACIYDIDIEKNKITRFITDDDKIKEKNMLDYSRRVIIDIYTTPKRQTLIKGQYYNFTNTDDLIQQYLSKINIDPYTWEEYTKKIAEMLHISRTKLIKFLSIHESSQLKVFIEEKNNKKINDVEALYSLAILEKDNPAIFDNKEFIDELNNENIPIRDAINKFKNSTKSTIKSEKKEKIKKSAKAINNIDINILDNSNFILIIDNKEFSLSQEHINKIKNILNDI